MAAHMRRKHAIAPQDAMMRGCATCRAISQWMAVSAEIIMDHLRYLGPASERGTSDGTPNVIKAFDRISPPP